jgi:quercetin dioxygenase-like cupin family protein
MQSSASTTGTDYSIRSFGIRVRVSAADTDGQLTILEHRLEPGYLALPLHTHARETETTYVLAGTLGVQLGARVLAVGAGETLVKPPGVPHTFWNTSERPVHFLELATPGGIEAYYREVRALIPAAGGVNIDAIHAVSERHGLSFDTLSLLDLIERHRVRLV